MGNGKAPLFLYSKGFTLETEQKPLVSIYKKHMVDISSRVQRLIVKSFPYLPFKVVYKKRKDIPVADALSCNPNGSRGQHPVTHHCSQHDHHTHPNECTTQG